MTVLLALSTHHNKVAEVIQHLQAVVTCSDGQYAVRAGRQLIERSIEAAQKDPNIKTAYLHVQSTNEVRPPACSLSFVQQLRFNPN